MRQPYPAKTIILDSLNNIRQGGMALIARAVLYFLVMTGLMFAIALFIPILWLSSLLILITIVIISSKLMVMLHRNVILKGDLPALSQAFSFERHDETFIFWNIGLHTLILIIAVLGGIIVVKLMPKSILTGDSLSFKIIVLSVDITLKLICFYFISRLLLILPAIAIEKKLAIKTAWKTTQGYGIQLTLLLFLLPTLGQMALSFIPMSNLYLIVLLNIMFIVWILFGVALLSNTYLFFFTEQTSETSP